MFRSEQRQYLLTSSGSRYTAATLVFVFGYCFTSAAAIAPNWASAVHRALRGTSFISSSGVLM